MLVQKIRTAIFLVLLLLATTTTAENSTKFNGFTIHHNAIPTAILTSDVASSYKITRSKYRGLLNISVIKDVPGTTGQPVSANVSAYAINLIGRRHNIALKQIQEGNAIYYIGDFPIVDGEMLTFVLEVTPEGSDRAAKATLKQEFYID
jgi:hypothetical protein